MTTAISEYMNLLRIEKSEDRDREIGNQKRDFDSPIPVHIFDGACEIDLSEV